MPIRPIPDNSVAQETNPLMHDRLRFDLQELAEHVHTAFKDWQKAGDVNSPLTEFHLFEHARQAQQFTDDPSALEQRQILNRMLLEELSHLATTHPQEAAVLRSRFVENRYVREVALRQNVSESTVYIQQREGIEHIAQRLIAQETALRGERADVLNGRLPAATATRLFGLEPHIDNIAGQLSTSQPPWIVSIEGIGGIGKTTLADAIVRHTIDDAAFADIGWVSAKSAVLDLAGNLRAAPSAMLSVDELIAALFAQLLPNLPLPGPERAMTLLRKRLKEQPHLVVIDNLETLEDLHELLPTLRSLTNPSKFLLTTRWSLYAEPGVFPYHVPELAQGDALSLLRYEATQTNLRSVSTADDAMLIPVYQTVGGNPLALRLVVGLARVYGLDVLLVDLTNASGQPAENLYSYIYRRAWDGLDELGRVVLLATAALAPGGDDLDFLLQIASLPREDVVTALNQLVTRNLINVSDEAGVVRYSLHSLTRTFLQEQVAKWQM
ncbi:MAG: hypothetical protein KDD84_07025 [Caldilineaceae bacterium]|nr:hypothetical protein [Caldilineaceae bacterium]